MQLILQIVLTGQIIVIHLRKNLTISRSHQKVEALKADTVGDMERRQASSVNKLGQVEDETQRIRSSIEENIAQNSQFQADVNQTIAGMQSSLNSIRQENNVKVAELNEKIAQLDAKILRMGESLGKAQQAKVEEAEKRAADAARRAEEARQKAAEAARSANTATRPSASTRTAAATGTTGSACTVRSCARPRITWPRRRDLPIHASP